MKNDLKKAFSLFLFFFKTGFFTFGGGWSIVAALQDEYVEKRKEISSEEILDIVSVGRSLPGIMIGNVSYLFGYHYAGIAGGILSVLGVITPPLIILSLVTVGYEKVRDNIYAARALAGVRCAVVPIIISAALKLRDGAYPYRICYLLTAAAMVLSFVFKINSVLLVLGGVISGLLIGRFKKEEKA